RFGAGGGGSLIWLT
ncbi:hypothetical protein VCNHCC010F_001478B, partial [Vibrio cholerae O1 str. NHCC-010F]